MITRNYRRYQTRVIDNDFNNPGLIPYKDYSDRIKYTYNTHKTVKKAKKEFERLVKMYKTYPEYIAIKIDSYHWQFKDREHIIKVILC